MRYTEDIEAIGGLAMILHLRIPWKVSYLGLLSCFTLLAHTSCHLVCIYVMHTESTLLVARDSIMVVLASVSIVTKIVEEKCVYERD